MLYFWAKLKLLRNIWWGLNFMYSVSRKGLINRNGGFLDAIFAGWTSLYCSSLRLKLVNSTRLWFRKVVLHLIREASSVVEVKQDDVSAEGASSLLLSGILSPSKGCSPSSGLQAGESSAEPLTWSYRSGHHCSCYYGNTSTATTAPAAATLIGETVLAVVPQQSALEKSLSFLISLSDIQPIQCCPGSLGIGTRLLEPDSVVVCYVSLKNRWTIILQKPSMWVFEFHCKHVSQ